MLHKHHWFFWHGYRIFEIIEKFHYSVKLASLFWLDSKSLKNVAIGGMDFMDLVRVIILLAYLSECFEVVRQIYFMNFLWNIIFNVFLYRILIL